MSKNDVVQRGQATSTLNLAPCRKVFNLFDHPLARFLRESRRRVVSRLLFPRFTWKYVCLRYEGEPGIKSFAPRTARRGWLLESWRDFSQSNRFCNVSPVNLAIRMLFNARWRNEAMNGEEIFRNFDE